MLNLIREIEGKLLDAMIAEGKSPEDESIKLEIQEWKLMKKKLAVVEKMSKALSGRIAELEKNFEEVIKGVDGNKAVIDGAILEYTQKKGNTTVKYKEAVDYALKMVNEAQKRVIEDFVTSVTKSGEIRNVLSITDPELEKYLIDLGDAKGGDMMSKIETAARAGFDRLPAQVKNAKKRVVKEGVTDNIAKVVKHLVSGFKRVFASFFKSMAKADKATASFLKAVKADPMMESDDTIIVSKTELTEMAASRKFTSGGMKSSEAKMLVKQFKAGEETYDMKDGRQFQAKKAVKGDMLEKGMIVLASYNSTNQGAQIYEVLGFTAPGDDSKPVYDTAKQAFKACKVASLRALSTLGRDERSQVYVKDLEDGDEGGWFYPYEGAWVRGSGAEKLSFTLVEEIKAK
jgi:hypothetical protein